MSLSPCKRTLVREWDTGDCLRGASGSPEIEADLDNLSESVRIGDELSTHYSLRSELYSPLTAKMTLAALVPYILKRFR